MDTIRIKLPVGQLLYEQGRWRGEGASDREVAIALDMTEDYRYSPGHGYPGYLLAQLIAARLEGEAILPELPPEKDGVVH